MILSRWNAKLPRSAPRDDKVHVVFGFKDSRDGRHELSGEFPEDLVWKLFEQLCTDGKGLS